MLLALTLGLTLGIVGKVLLQQWLDGALTEPRESAQLSPIEFPRLAPSRRAGRAGGSRPAFTPRRAA